MSLSGIPSMCEPPLQPAASTVARQVPLSGSPSTWSRFTAAIRVLCRAQSAKVITFFLIPTSSSHTGICLRIYMIIESEASLSDVLSVLINPYPTAFPYGNGVVLHFYQQQESSTTKTVHKVINKGLKAYV